MAHTIQIEMARNGGSYSGESFKARKEAVAAALKIMQQLSFDKFVAIGDDTWVRADLVEAIYVEEEE